MGISLMFVIAGCICGIGVFGIVLLHHHESDRYQGIEPAILVSMLLAGIILAAACYADLNVGGLGNYILTGMLTAYLVWAGIQCHRLHFWKRFTR